MAAIPTRTSLVMQVAELLRRGIDEGEWVTHLPGEVELSQQLQISRATLRAALQILTREGRLRSSQGRRRTIVKLAKPGRLTKRPRRVVLLSTVPLEQMGSFRILLVDILRGHLAKAGVELEIHAHHAGIGRRPEKTLRHLTEEKQAAAWVLFSATAAAQRWFMEQRLPCIIAGSRHEGVVLPMVEVDYRGIGQHAAWQFLSRNHRRLVLLTPKLRMAGDELTAAGFREACAQVQNAEARVVEHDGTPGGVIRQLNSLLRQNAPTGLLVAAVPHALTVSTHLAKIGVRVPRDMSLIVRDSDPLMEHVVPQLTRYVIHAGSFGAQLARAVVTLLREGPLAVKDRHLVPGFLRGETLARLSANQTS
ncbi:MAG TPA: substrate-binding domain-containing protein [Prosthecobacter sp.]|nr:substrate-binding domain-containing protein [Prosthecobacter sp.]